jgi:putative heme iron utilization protein
MAPAAPEILHQPRLNRLMAELLAQHRVASLGTLDEQGLAALSMVPFALLPEAPGMVVHVSGLAAHTRAMQLRPDVSLLVMQPEVSQEPVHALARVSLLGLAQTLHAEGDSAALWARCRGAYLHCFPEAEPMTELGDFRFVLITIHAAYQVAGFGAARDVATEDLPDIWALAIQLAATKD